MDKENVALIHNGNLFTYSEEQNHVICRKMHAAADKHTKRGTPVSERQIAYVSSDFHVDP